MDKLSQAAVESNFGVMKEPRGFIRFIELVIAIFAFATTTSHSTTTKFTVKCDDGGSQQSTIDVSYAYRLSSSSCFDFNNCTTTREVCPYGSFASAAEFYVFVGIMAFLYSIAALVLYICFDEKYRKFDWIPIADFVATIVFTILWLISSAAWADGVAKVKTYSDPDELFIRRIPECKDNDACVINSTGNWASLNVSIIFGFLNMLVWGGNLWFLYKETKWFKVQTEHPERTEPQPTDGQQNI